MSKAIAHADAGVRVRILPLGSGRVATGRDGAGAWHAKGAVIHVPPGVARELENAGLAEIVDMAW